jgi:hypothetical protein
MSNDSKSQCNKMLWNLVQRLLRVRKMLNEKQVLRQNASFHSFRELFIS